MSEEECDQLEKEEEEQEEEEARQRRRNVLQDLQHNFDQVSCYVAQSLRKENPSKKYHFFFFKGEKNTKRWVLSLGW